MADGKLQGTDFCLYCYKIGSIESEDIMEKPAICGGTPVRDTKIFYGHQYLDQADYDAVLNVLKSDYLCCDRAFHGWFRFCVFFHGTRRAEGFSELQMS